MELEKNVTHSNLGKRGVKKN